MQDNKELAKVSRDNWMTDTSERNILTGQIAEDKPPEAKKPGAKGSDKVNFEQKEDMTAFRGQQDSDC